MSVILNKLSSVCSPGFHVKVAAFMIIIVIVPSLCSLKNMTHTYSGANLHAKDGSNCTPIHLAAKHNCINAYHSLMKDVQDHGSIIFLAFEIKCSDFGTILKVCPVLLSMVLNN